MNNSNRKKNIWALLCGVLFAVCALLLIYLVAVNKQRSDMKADLTSAHSTIKQREAEIAELKAKLATKRTPGNNNALKNNILPLADKDSFAELEKLGVTEPMTFITESLLNNSHIIPLQGVLGGAFRFNREGIFLLMNNRVWANVDDGHVMASVLLKYEIKSKDEIKWTVLDAFEY